VIEELARLIPDDLKPRSGKVFYSGRAAWNREGGLYVLGMNPGGAPEAHPDETVERHTRDVLTDYPDYWSAYHDEQWVDHSPGKAPLQRRMAHLFNVLEVDLRNSPASNLIFARSRRGDDLGAEEGPLVDECWPFHEEVLSRLKPTGVICLGKRTCARFLVKIGQPTRLVRSYRALNGQHWKSDAWKTGSGLLVFGLTHPSVANWINPASDPSPMVRDVFRTRGLA